MRRREFLAAAGAAAPAAQAEFVLLHKHILSIFVGADQIRPGRYDRDEVFRIALPNLEELRLDCTPNYPGRAPELLARLSAATNLEIWSTTGLYGAANHQ